MQKTFLFLLITSFFPFLVSGQSDYELLNYVRQLNSKVYISNNDSTSPAHIISEDSLDLFTEIPEGYITKPNETYWYCIDLQSLELPRKDNQLYIRFPYYDKITLYTTKNDTIVTKEAGLRNKRADDILDFSDIPFDTLNLINGRYLYARVQDYANRNTLQDVILHNSFSLEFFDYYQSRSSQRRGIPYYLFIGGMALIIAFFVGYYFLYRDRLFIVYSVYLFALLLYLGSKAGFVQNFLREYFTAYLYFFNNIIQVIVNISSLFFAIAFLNAKKDYPKLYVFIRYTIYLLAIVVFLISIIYIINPFSGVEETILNIERYYMILFSLLAYVHILMNYKNPLVIFYVGGSFTFLSGAVLALFFRNVQYMMYGAAIEVFIFSLGMGYKTKQIEAEKNKIEGEMDRVKLTALRAQMNPHFIFNSLNSIRAYVISNKVKEASEYLSKFAQLIRLILHYSSKENIELHKELEALKLYIQLEELRFREDFEFKVQIDEKIEVNKVLVPPLILQPYIENAIRHGLAPKHGKKSLKLKVNAEYDHIVFSVKDNGVGRKYSKKVQAQQNSKHKSIAMDLTKRRINLMGLKNLKNDQVVIHDRYKDDKPNGTEVIITLPMRIKH